MTLDDLKNILSLQAQLRAKDERITALLNQRNRAWDKIDELEAHIEHVERTRYR
jgi:peptidoglycan hydrolase CwlO-like protein